jgi:acyl-CoA thioesterase-2
VDFDRQLSVRRISDDSFESFPEGSGFLFGGHTMGLLLRTAHSTVRDGMIPKSMHTYFLRPGRTEETVHLEALRLTDGRSFAVRQVSVVQGGKTLAVATISFHVPASGDDWQVPHQVRMPVPDDLPPHELSLPDPKLIEVRPTVPRPTDAPTSSLHPYWGRASSDIHLSELHFVGLSYTSDYLVIRSILSAGLNLPDPNSVRTLDHAIWFHRPFDFRDWHLFTADPQSITDGRGLVRGTVRAGDGALIASFDQEVIIPG